MPTMISDSHTVTIWADKTWRKMMNDQILRPFCPPLLSLKLASQVAHPSPSFLLHFETVYIFPPWSAASRNKKKKKQVGVQEKRKRELEGREGHRMGGETHCGETAYTWV